VRSHYFLENLKKWKTSDSARASGLRATHVFILYILQQSTESWLSVRDIADRTFGTAAVGTIGNACSQLVKFGLLVYRPAVGGYQYDLSPELYATPSRVSSAEVAQVVTSVLGTLGKSATSDCHISIEVKVYLTSHNATKDDGMSLKFNRLGTGATW
jgi:hypothetical protein